MRVLIIRLRAIGDVIHGLPVACAIKDRFPGAFVGWLAEDWASDVLEGHASIDQRIALPRRWERSPLALWNLRRDLRASRFDVVVDLQGVRGSVLAALLSGARRRLGFVGMISHQWRHLISDADRLRSLSRVIARGLKFELVQAGSTHIVDRYLEILRPLGVVEPGVRFDVPISESTTHEVDRLLQDVGVGSEPFAVFNPGGPPARVWPAERFGSVATYLGESRRLPTLVVQGPNDRERAVAQGIVATGGPHARLCPPLSVARLAGLARRSSLFLSGDTGPLHLAAAVGARCIGLFGHDQSERFRPRGDGSTVLVGTAVPLDRTRRQGLGADAMKAIDVDAVCRACDRVLEVPRPR